MSESDETLHGRLIAGDMRAFDELYERFERPLFGFLRVQLRDAQEAEDILHEAFMTILRERQADVRSFRAWLFTVARNLCLNRIRSRKRAGRALEAVPEPEQEDTHEKLERHERAALLERAVGKLPEPLAEVYRLRGAGMSYEEVAEILEVPLGTVKSRMHEMVRTLREEVEHAVR